MSGFESERREKLDQWSEPDIDAVSAALSVVDKPWWIAGGVALDLFANRAIRSHHDVDVVIFAADATSFRRGLANWDIHAAIGWTGQPRESQRVLRRWPASDPLPKDTGAFWCRPSPNQPWCFELLVNPGSSDRWHFKRDARISRPVSEVSMSRNGLPFLAPEIVLLHKATSATITEQDTSDLLAVVDSMTLGQRSWLSKTISRISHGHPWLKHLDGTSRSS